MNFELERSDRPLVPAPFAHLPIWLGNIERSPEDRQIERAARDSGADEAIAKFPPLYDIISGKWSEGGEEPSIARD